MSRIKDFKKKAAKAGKLNKDVEFIKRKEAENAVKEHSEYGGVKNVQQLAAEGNIEEAAAVFSYEGMKIFHKLFIENPVEGALEKVLTERMPDIIEKVVEKKIFEFMSGYTNGINNFANNMGEQITRQVENTINETISKFDESSINEVEKESKKQPRSNIKEELKILINYLKENPEPVKAKNLPEYLPDIHWGVSVSSKINNFLKYTNNIKNVGRGLYQYQAD